MSRKTKFSKLKKGEFFRFEGKKKVYIFDGGGPVRGYKYTADNDINSQKTTKVDRVVVVGFTY